MECFLDGLYLSVIALGGYLFLANTYTKKWRYWRYIVCSLLLTVYATACFEEPFFAAAFYGGLFFVGFSVVPFVLKTRAGKPISGGFVLREMSYASSFCFLLVLSHILMWQFWPIWLADSAITFLQFIYLVPSIIFIAYYSLDGDIFSTESYIAIYQTNGREAKNFIKESLTFARGLFFCAVVVSLLAVLYFINAALSMHIKDSASNIMILSLLLVFAFLSIKATIKGAYFYRIIVESKDYLKALKKWQQSKKEINFTAKTGRTNKGKDRVFVLVIGESQSRDHFGAYGYKRTTTPWLSSMDKSDNLLLFRNAYSCHVLTELVLSKALTETSQYRKKSFEEALSIIDIAKKAGLKTYFLSNQEKHSIFGSSCTLIAGEADVQVWTKGDTKAITVYDEELLPAFARYSNETGDKLFIIHLMGSHFEYKDRYPHDFNIFDRCRDICTEGAKCQEKVCHYDNSIRYTDHILEEIYRIATENYKADSIMYFSDHGEAVARDKKHLPGLFGFDMTRIPFWMYFSEEYHKENPELVELLRTRQDAYFTNDMMYDTLLGIMGIETERYNSRQDLSSPAYDFGKENLLTMNGAVCLGEEEENLCCGSLASIAVN